MAVVTNTVKKNNLPLQDPNNPNAPMQIQQPQQTDFNAVLGAANQSSMQINKMAQQGFSSPTIQATSQQTQQLLKDPTQGQNYQQNINTRLAQQDRERAQAVETARQGLAGMSGSSLNQNALVDIALKGAEQRADLQTQLESEAAQAKQDAIYKALAEGRATSGVEQGAYESNINALSKAIGATDIERQAAATAKENATERQFTSEQNALDRALQTSLKSMDTASAKEITELKGKIDAGMLTTEQDWKTVQNELDRAAATALQSGDIQGQLQIAQLKGEIEKQAQSAQQAWQTGERVASQAYNTTERLSTQDYESAEKYLDRQAETSKQMQDYYNKLNLQSNEFNQQETMAKLQADIDNARADGDLVRAQKLGQFQNALQLGLQDDAQNAQLELAEYEASNQRYLQDQSAQLQLKLQTQGFGQEEKMAYLDSSLAEAKANGDVNRQKQIISYQTGENLRTMVVENGYDVAMEKLRGDIQKALQDNDQIASEALQNARLNFEGQQAAENRILEQARIALQKKQVDLQQVEQQYNQIASMVDQGLLAPDAQFDFLKRTLDAQGINTADFNMVNAEEAAKKALQAEYDLQKNQFMQTHPEYSEQTWTDGTGKSWTLKDLEALGAGYTADWANQNMQAGETKISPEGNVAMNEFINSTLYGEETAAQKEAKSNAGYLNASDISTASPGQKFNFNQNVEYNGKTIPAGKYAVDTSDVGHGNKFFGTAYTNTHTYLVNQDTGAKYEVDMNKSGKTGNIISNLWAG